MKTTIVISAVLLLTACGAKEQTFTPRLPVSQTLTHKAYYYYGLNEIKDRNLLKNILGVDPVVTQWCAAFVNMILLENDLPTSESVSRYYLTARSFLTYGQEVTEPRQGDIIVFPRGNQGWQGHVGFYVSSTTINGAEYYNIIGGNQNDSVTITPYLSSSALTIRRTDEAVLGPAQDILGTIRSVVLQEEQNS
mgnify:FL=1